MKTIELEYIGRPTHYQVPVEGKGQKFKIPLPNGRIPMVMDFIGTRVYKQLAQIIELFNWRWEMQEERYITLTKRVPFTAWEVKQDEDGQDYILINLEDCHTVDGTIRMLLVEPEKEQN